jgi:hypothetical protein
MNKIPNMMGSILMESHCFLALWMMMSSDMPRHKRRKSNAPEHTQSWRKSCFVRLIWRLDKIHFVVPSEKEGMYWRRVGKYFHEHRKFETYNFGSDRNDVSLQKR